MTGATPINGKIPTKTSQAESLGPGMTSENSCGDVKSGIVVLMLEQSEPQLQVDHCN